MVIGKSKSGVSGRPSANQYEFSTSTVCKKYCRKNCGNSITLKKINDIIKGGQSVIL